MCPYSISTGAYEGYFWLRSNAPLAYELLCECFELLENRYLIVTTYDGVSINPSDPEKEPWSSIGNPRLIAKAGDIPWSGNGEELFLFDAVPDDEMLRHIRQNDGRYDLTMQAAMYGSDNDSFAQVWREMLQICPTAYICGAESSFIATSEETMFLKMVESKVVRELATRHTREADAKKRAQVMALGDECGPERCKSDGCPKLRIQSGIFCAEHHLSMLKNTSAI